jgi:hypothetical protein
VPKDSRLAAASTVHIAGESTGVVGALSAKGLKSALARLDIATVTTSPGPAAVTVEPAGCCTVAATVVAATVVAATVVAAVAASAVSVTCEIATLAVGAASVTGDSSTVLLDAAVSDSVRAVVGCVGPVDTWGGWAGLLDGGAALDRLLVRGVVESGGVAVSLESVDSSGVLVSEVCLPSEPPLVAESSGEVAFGELVFGDADAGRDVVPDDSFDEPADVDDVDVAPPLEPVDVDEFVDDESDPDVPDGSADAIPCPVATAAPIPRATASPPIRPTYIPAATPIYIPWMLQGRGHVGRIAGVRVTPVNSTVTWPDGSRHPTRCTSGYRGTLGAPGHIR